MAGPVGSGTRIVQPAESTGTGLFFATATPPGRRGDRSVEPGSAGSRRSHDYKVWTPRQSGVSSPLCSQMRSPASGSDIPRHRGRLSTA
jgi:hypothetical protein